MIGTGSDRFEQSIPQQREIELLQSDAYKPGYWQAKLAYAKFLMKLWPDFKQAQNLADYIKKFLDEVAGSRSDYVAEAELLIATHFYNGKQDRIKINKLSEDIATEKSYLLSLSTNPSLPIQDQAQSKICSSLDYQYKLISYTYDDDKIKNDHHRIMGEEEKRIHFYEIINTAISKFENLLQEAEMTDALLAKIYFRLIELCIERANLKGYESDLMRAKHYCKLLMDNRNLQDMDKAQRAALIYNEINRPVRDFKQHMKGAFDAGKEGNRILFKYVGIIIGNVLDLPLFCIFKLFGNNSKSGASYFFKHSGLASAGKYLGGLFGKHIVGNIIGGPIAAILGLISYPIMHSYFKDNVEDKKGLVAKVRGINAPVPSSASTSSSSVVIQKKIFDRKPREPKIFHTDTELEMETTVTSEASLVKSSAYDAPYGRVLGIFGNEQNKNQVPVQAINSILTAGYHKKFPTVVNNPTTVVPNNDLSIDLGVYQLQLNKNNNSM